MKNLALRKLSLALQPDHLLVHHFIKTAGTSLREVLAAYAAAHGVSIQFVYKGNNTFEKKRPATILFGHHVTLDFHLQLPTTASHRYVTMLREPFEWSMAFYFQFHRHPERPSARSWATRPVAAHMIEWLNETIAQCPAIQAWPRADGRRGCKSKMSYWLGSRQALSATRTPGCRGIVDVWVGSGALLLLTERYAQSLELLSALLGTGRSANPSLTPQPEALNRRNDTFYARPHAFAEAVALSRLVQGTCMPDVYAAARRSFAGSWSNYQQGLPV